jgi:hypothetical protein
MIFFLYFADLGKSAHDWRSVLIQRSYLLSLDTCCRPDDAPNRLDAILNISRDRSRCSHTPLGECYPRASSQKLNSKVPIRVFDSTVALYLLTNFSDH